MLAGLSRRCLRQDAGHAAPVPRGDGPDASGARGGSTGTGTVTNGRGNDGAGLADEARSAPESATEARDLPLATASVAVAVRCGTRVTLVVMDIIKTLTVRLAQGGGGGVKRATDDDAAIAPPKVGDRRAPPMAILFHAGVEIAE